MVNRAIHSSQHLRVKHLLISLLFLLPAVPASFSIWFKMAAFHNSVWDLHVFTLGVWGVVAVNLLPKQTVKLEPLLPRVSFAPCVCRLLCP